MSWRDLMGEDGVAILAIVLKKGGKQVIIVGAKDGPLPDGPRRHMQSALERAASELEECHPLIPQCQRDQDGYRKWLENRGAA